MIDGYQHIERLSRQGRAQIRKAVAWWVEGLWIGLPQAFREHHFRWPKRLIVRFDSGSLHVAPIDAATETVAVIPLQALEHEEPKLDAKTRTMLHDADVTVVVPNEARLTKTVALPLAAMTDLRRVLGYELDRLTPFDMNLCVFDYVVRNRVSEGDRIVVEFVVVPKQALDRYLGYVHAAGLRPSTVSGANAAGEILPLNLLGTSSPLLLPRLKTSPRPVLIAAAVLAMASVLYVPLERYDALLANFEAAVEAQREAAVEARSRLDAHAARTVGTEFLNERLANYVPPLDLLAELTHALEQDTWLSRFSMRGRDLSLQGESRAPSHVLEIVEATALLDSAEFQAPVSRGQTAGKQQFSIAAQVVETQ